VGPDHPSIKGIKPIEVYTLSVVALGDHGTDRVQTSSWLFEINAARAHLNMYRTSVSGVGLDEAWPELLSA